VVRRTVGAGFPFRHIEVAVQRLQRRALQRSVSVICGRMPGKRTASIDLPVPGGPTISTLCPPAAAISSGA